MGPRAETTMSKEADDLFRRAGAAQRAAMERALSKLELTPAQFAVMEWLEREPGLSGAEIARRERLTPPTTSVIVANLERKGLSTRHPGPKGGRAQYLELTELGHSRVEAGAKAVESARRRLTAGLDPSLQQALLAWLRRVAELGV
jgi:DNA-binding MarR family transcriptional regulator